MKTSQWHLTSFRAYIDLSVLELLISGHVDSRMAPLDLTRSYLHIGV